MNVVKPEDVGVYSENIIKYIKILEKHKLSTHNLIFTKGDNIFFEHYWEPFKQGDLHRMYSISKSFVSIAIGFLEQDNLISLDDTLIKYFKDELKNQTDEYMGNQTIRDMLMMSTAKQDRNWFAAKPNDRVQYYFDNDNIFSRHPGLIFQYDSSGSFVLGALVERITKMPFMDYLRLKLFDKIGVSKEAYCLKCPGGHSWGDSGVLCTPLDLLKVARFVMNKGKWNGEQILNTEYLNKATSKQIDNNLSGYNDYDTQGYGYQFWMTYDNSFFFNGMGCQLAVCVPDKDLIMIYNGDNQGNDMAKKIIIDNFFDLIANSDKVETDNNAYNILENYTQGLTLSSAHGNSRSKFSDKISGVTYLLDKNPMGINRIKLTFSGETGAFEYTNEQGDKKISFGMCKNEYGFFPQEGYSNNVGAVFEPNNYYRCAASAAWVEPHKLFIKVQIIDKYFGSLNITLGFKEDTISICMKKYAEDFLKEYQGFSTGEANV